MKVARNTFRRKNSQFLVYLIILKIFPEQSNQIILRKLKKTWNPNFIRYAKLSGAKDLSNTDIEEKILENEKIENEIESSETSEEEDDLTETEATSLFILFLLYIAFGGMMLAAYEPDMDFFKAVYFNFVTLTSIGLGDIVPRRYVHYCLVKLISEINFF